MGSLTDKQITALKDIRDEKVSYHRFGYSAWRMLGPSNPTVVGRVLSLGLAKWVAAPNSIDAKIAVLTDDGRAALAKAGA